MKLHLPKMLLTAVLAACIAPATWGANDLNLANAPGNFWAGNYAFSFQIDENDLDATEDTTDVLALYWGAFNGGNLYTNGITLTATNDGITLYVGDGSKANAGANNGLAEITESTTFTGSRGATFTSTLEVGATYTLVNKGANQNQTVMLLKNGVYQETVTYNGNMAGGNTGTPMKSVWNDDYAPGNVLVWNGTSNSSSFERSNFIGGNATLAESDLIFASGIDGVTTTVNVSGAIAAGSISIYDSYIFNATAATTLSTTEGLSIASGKTLTLQGATTTLSGSITNNGTLTASNVTLSGTVTNNGTLNLAGFTVAADTTASVTGTGTINLSGTITNEGTLNLAGFTMDTTASITGAGATTLSGAVTVTNNGSLTLNNATLHSSVTNNGTLNLNGALNISSLAGLEQNGSYSDGNNGVFTGSFSVVTSGAGAVLNLGDSFALQLNGSALDTSTDAATYYTYDSSKGSIKIFETGNQTYWINTNAAYDANNEKMLNAESFTVAAGAEFYLTDASVLSKTLIPTDTSKVYFRASGSETNLLRFTGASGGAGLSLTATVNTTNPKVTTGNSASSYAGNIIVLEGTTLELGATGAVAVAGKTYDADRNRFITVERGATLDVKGNEAYYHVVLEDGAKLTNSGSNVETGWKALPYVELQGDATIEASSQMVMQKGGSDTNPGTFQLALNGHKLTKTGTNMLYLQNVSIGSGTLQIDAGTVETASGVTLVSGAALDVIINDGTLKTGSDLSLRNLTLGAGADAVNVNSNTLTVTGNTRAAGTFTKSGAGTLKLQGATTFGGGVNVEGGSLQVTGELTDAGAINKTGSGTLELATGSGQKKINGTSTITNGILAITQHDAIDYDAETSMSISGATLQLDARQTVDSSNSFELNSGTISGDGGANDMMNDVKVGLEVYNDSTLKISSEGTSSITTNIGFRTEAGKVEYTVTSGTLTNSGIIASHNNGTTGAVVKKGAGELILSGANTYAGGTTIEGGVLEVGANGALGTGEVNIGSAGTLTIANGATFTNTIKGSGTYALGSRTDLQGTLDSTWTGTVSLSGEQSGADLNTYGNANSTVELKSVTGSLNEGTINTNVKFTSGESGGNATPGLKVTRTTGKTVTFAGAVSSTNENGDLVVQATGEDAAGADTYVFQGDVSGWTGKFIAASDANIKYEGNATTIKNDILSSGGALSVTFGGETATTVEGAVGKASLAGEADAAPSMTVTNTAGVTFKQAVKTSSTTLAANTTASFEQGGSLGNLTLGNLTLGSDALVTTGGELTIGTLNVTLSDTMAAGSYQLVSTTSGSTITWDDVAATGTLAEGRTWSISGVAPGTLAAQTAALVSSGGSSTSGIWLVISQDVPSITDVLVSGGAYDAATNMLTLNVVGTNGLEVALDANGAYNIVGLHGNADWDSIRKKITDGKNPVAITLQGAGEVSVTGWGDTDNDPENAGTGNVSFYGKYYGETGGTAGSAGSYNSNYIPEPASATLSLLALAGLAARRRRKA